MKNKKLFSAISLLILLVCIFTVAIIINLDFFYVKYFYLSGIFFLGCFVYSSSLSKKWIKIILLFKVFLYTIFYTTNPSFIRFDFLLLVMIALLACLAGFYKRLIIKMNNDISYGLYIIAYPVQQIVFKLTGYNQSVILQLFLTLLVSVPLAFLSWKFIENPFINLNRRNMNSINYT